MKINAIKNINNQMESTQNSTNEGNSKSDSSINCQNFTVFRPVPFYPNGFRRYGRRNKNRFIKLSNTGNIELNCEGKIRVLVQNDLVTKLFSLKNKFKFKPSYDWFSK